MDSEQVPLAASRILPTHFQFSASYCIGLIGLSVGLGFYGLIFVLMWVAWALSAPNIPTPTEGAAVFRAMIVHLFPLSLWLVYRRQISSLPSLLKWVMAVGTWLLVLGSLAVMAYYLGV